MSLTKGVVRELLFQKILGYDHVQMIEMALTEQGSQRFLSVDSWFVTEIRI